MMNIDATASYGLSESDTNNTKSARTYSVSVATRYRLALFGIDRADVSAHKSLDGWAAFNVVMAALDATPFPVSSSALKRLDGPDRARRSIVMNGFVEYGSTYATFELDVIITSDIQRCEMETNGRTCPNAAVVAVQGESDSFGTEILHYCDACSKVHAADVAQRALENQTCEWCKKSTLCYEVRDPDEGTSGPVYTVCSPCDRENRSYYLRDMIDDDEVYGYDDEDAIP